METNKWPIHTFLNRHVILSLVILLFFSVENGFAGTTDTGQGPITVTGKITSGSDSMPLIGVSIVVKGTAVGTVSDVEGDYKINVPSNATLVFSYIGYVTREIAVAGRANINIVMEESAETLREVVVTALGISREEKSLGYSVGKLGSEEIAKVVHENVLTSMAGKVTGVTINSTGGAGSTVSMIIRGATSMSTDNQPLFVIDGVPMGSSVNNVGGFGNGNLVDYGNAISDIDPESIESVSILKGPSAAALYGTRAGNGVVLITTKKSDRRGGMKVEVVSNTVFDIPSRYLDVQNRFGFGSRSYTGSTFPDGIIPAFNPSEQAGAGPELNKGYWQVQPFAPLDANGVPIPTELVSYPDNYKHFINSSAITTTNSVAISSSNDKLNYRLGVSNMTNKGLVPNSDLNRNNLTLAAVSEVMKGLTVTTDINYTQNWADNRPATQERGANPLQWAAWTPPNVDIRKLKDYALGGGEVLNIGKGWENPYFLAYGVNNSFKRNRLIGNVSLTWEIIPQLSVMGRYALNRSDDVKETKMDPGYSKEPNNGAYGIVTSESTETNADMLATYKNRWNDFSLTASAGGNLLYSTWASVSNSSKPGSGLIIPYLYTIQNIENTSLSYFNARYERAINSLYAMANLGWRDMAYLDLTARNDWASTLPAQNRSYFYPSASLSLLLNNMFDMGRDVNLLKIRGGIAQVGNDTSPYSLYATYHDAGQWGDAIRLGKPGDLLNPTLLPEELKSYEVGMDLKMFNNRLRFEGTWYRADNRNQILSVPLAGSTGFGSIKVNSGLLQSKGMELMLGFTPIETKDWRWDLNVNFTKNKTWLLQLSEGTDFVQFWNEARVRNIAYAKDESLGRDGLIGNLYTRKILRVTDKNSKYYGYPLLPENDEDAEWQSEDDYSKAGNYNPDFIMGLQTSVTYKNFTLSMTFDWRSGGQYVSQTWRYLTEGVVSNTWLNQLVTPPDGLGGSPSQALRDWVVANADRLIYTNNPRPVGGPTPDFGGFYNTFFTGVGAYDGTFAPGVYGRYDDNGNFILIRENLGNEGTEFRPYVMSYPWDIGEVNIFDADYVKLREIALNYSVPDKAARKLRMRDLNISVYSRNIMLWTKNAGMGIDPERAYQSDSGGGFKQGVERFNAEPWVVPVGFKLSFTF
ncbi:SusC/RagA family TonB-linked outer membrane protein [Proteiniphilum sp. X52]|uniref:SusC/RagA family TonB-linked outer membrane protein n=1 Tax=Proteiniphilum sp. X52 TaxID=2382159 RepID=UPI000F0A559D|nr:SusC/RagA family TonB-linked outer membrane protein [Proteiniphilum sp. X52]RNC66529.1 SusC/RagA family TonB-linked outer membrane protein [Proteiniphilum sp. X52]